MTTIKKVQSFNFSISISPYPIYPTWNPFTCSESFSYPLISSTPYTIPSSLSVTCCPLALFTFKCPLSQPSTGLLDAPGGSGGPMVSPPQHCHSAADRTLRKVSAVKRSRSSAAPHTAHRGEPLYHRLQRCSSSRHLGLHSSQNTSTE